MRKKHLHDRYLANLKGHIISKDPYYSGFKSLSKVRVIIFIDLDLPPELTGLARECLVSSEDYFETWFGFRK